MADTGRTVSKWVDFRISDSGRGTIRSIPVNSISALGVTYDETELTAWMDAVKGFLPNMPDTPIEISGPFDTTIAAAAGSLSGSHTIISALVGAVTGLTIDVQVGIRSAWDNGEPQYGITGTATAGYICVAYNVDLNSMTYTARFVPIAGSTLPAWGTAAETT
jgi:hypothetical protein